MRYLGKRQHMTHASSSHSSTEERRGKVGHQKDSNTNNRRHAPELLAHVLYRVVVLTQLCHVPVLRCHSMHKIIASAKGRGLYSLELWAADKSACIDA
jgi:hypothetical protein